MFLTFRRHFIPLAWILTATSVPALADDLSFVNSSWTQVWANFGTSPYQAVDKTQSDQVIHIFCLDFNDEIAPPYDWQANIRPLDQANVTSYTQFGGNYGFGITPDADNASFAFTQDPLGSADWNSAYIRYLEVAWLFSNIEAGVKGLDAQTEIISQVAAWELFVEAKNMPGLQNLIIGTGNSWTFTNYQYSPNYLTAPGTLTGTAGLSFEDAVDEALYAAQNAIVHNWANSQYFGTWDIVTADPAWVTSYGMPAQEFLTYDAPVPEPAAVFLFGAVLVGVAISVRRKSA